jgi:hypothetical protein
MPKYVAVCVCVHVSRQSAYAMEMYVHMDLLTADIVPS